MSNSIEKPTIGFAGMSHLGLVSAVATASKGFRIIAYDSSSSLITNIHAGHLAVQEPGLTALLSQYTDQLSFTNQIECLHECDIIYISADVPTTERNISNITPIRTMIEKISHRLSQHTIVIILSQVPPGFTRQLPIPNQQLFYQVETLIFGQAMQRALQPEQFIIGCANPNQLLPQPYQTVLSAFACPVLPMRYESAEFAKVSLNVLLISSVTTSNILAEISASIAADWHEIVPALQRDRRIGPHAYLKPGLGIAGGNLERDLMTTIQLSEKLGANTAVLNAYLENSNDQKEWVYRCLQRYVFPHCANPEIAILGLAYKENTNSTKNSPSLSLLQKVQKNNVRTHDPVARIAAGASVSTTASIEQAVKGADVLIIMTPWTEYANIKPTWLRQRMQGNWIIDPFQRLDHNAFEALGFHLFTLWRTPTRLAIMEQQHA